MIVKVKLEKSDALSDSQDTLGNLTFSEKQIWYEKSES